MNNTSSLRRKLIIIMSILALSFAFASVANATDGQTLPHGGYDVSTNSCLSCHDIHEAAGDYVLMRWNTVTNTCGSCHTLYLGSTPDTVLGIDNAYRNPAQGDVGFGTGAKVYGSTGDQDYTADYFPGTTHTVGSASGLTAYTVDWNTERQTAGGHKLSQGNGNFVFADGVTDDANYIPGGSTNNTLNAIELDGMLDTDGDVPPSGDLPSFGATDATDFNSTAGLYCASCHTPHGEWGQMIDAEIAPYILSSRPNHSLTLEDDAPEVAERIDVMGDWLTDGGAWCSVCHDKRRSRIEAANGDALDTPGLGADNEGTQHDNHPDTWCLSCHGDYDGQEGGDFPSTEDVDQNGDDFPHTGPIQNILAAVPDELCIRCHVYGTLP